ncbi:MAG: type I-F CRISPR-associated endoribonuclease Cas6/Csy4 [Marinobacterium sp.]|nr:type I-F CRISPR-associated endoribonuclease Cas6/Csy4 [Marinobacterium sp.]
MSSHYLQLTLLPDPEFSVHLLMDALLNKLHRALVSQQSDNIGISFPGWHQNPRSLGTQLRLHGSNAALQQLMADNWLRGMNDHLERSAISPVPDSATPGIVRRRHFKTSAERLRRRRMKRHNESYEQATAAIPATVERTPSLPWATLRSASSSQRFQLFIDQQPAKQHQAGRFNCYGLSNQATVPLF